MKTQKTLIILKPDTITRGIAGKVTDRLESKGLKLVACKMSMLTEDILKEHYAHIANKPFFPSIVEFMTCAPVILQVWEGTEAVDVVRQTIGVTNSRQAQPGTIRGDYAMSIARNVIHASESLEAADVEVKRFFSANEIYSYKRSDDAILYENEER